jgi:hypothetical protein
MEIWEAAASGDGREALLTTPKHRRRWEWAMTWRSSVIFMDRTFYVHMPGFNANIFPRTRSRLS